ncbi:MAG: TonB-dependent receptor [Proteobacteria bacterium]|nr:TonB-dependent receptor [Pseudomonadota bacterium]
MLKGEVVDQADTPLAGVNLTLLSDSLQGTRETVTGEDGRFRFLALPPGTYRVDVVKEGFRTIIRQNLVISLGKTVSIKLVMELPEVGETVEVIDRRPLIDTESTTQSMSLNSDFLKNLPSGRSFQDVVQFLPGVTGGGNPNINGGTLQSNQYYLDGSNTTDPVTGTFSMNFNFDAIEDLEVITAGYDARYNQGLGGTINIVTKSGGNTFEGTFSGYYQTSGLQAAGNAYNSQRRSDFDRLEGNASLGGPIIKDRFWFFIAYQYNWSRSLPASNIDNGRDFALFPLSPRTWSSHFIIGKLTAQPFAANKFTFTFRTDPTDINNLDAGNVYTVDSAQRLWRQGGLGLTLAHEVQILGRAVLTTTASYNYSTILITPQNWKGCTDRDARGVCLDEDLHAITTWGGFGQFGPGLNTATGNYNLNRRHNLQIRSDLQINLDRLLGSHTIYAGVSVNPGWENFEAGYHKNQILIRNPDDADGSGFLESSEVSDVANYNEVGRYLIVNTGAERSPGVKVDAYLQDSWSPTRGLQITLGARLQHSNLKNNLGESIIDTTAVSWGPTISWDPFRDGKTQLLASYSQNVDPGLLALSTYISRSAFASEFYAWEPDQRRYGEEGGRATSPAGNITHPDFVPARSHEVFVRAQREIARDLAAEANFIYRDFTNMWEDDEVNFVWNKDGTNPVGFRNGQDSTVYRLRTPQDGHRTYWALQLIVRKQLSDNFQMLASYSFSRLLSNSSGRGFGDRVGTSVDFDNPTQRWYEDGIASSDQTHILKIAASYDNPGLLKVSDKFSLGYAVGGTLDFASGTPLNRLQRNEYFGSYSNYIYKRGTRERLPAWLDLNLRASLALTIASTQVDIIVQAFNLLNTTEVASADERAIDSDGDAVTGSNGDPVYASPTSYYAPRRFEVGVRFSF